MGVAFKSITPTIAAVVPGFNGNAGFSVGFIPNSAATKTFLWTGIDWTGEMLLARLVVMLAPLLLVALAAVVFGRFDPARSWRRPRAASRKTGQRCRPCRAMKPRAARRSAPARHPPGRVKPGALPHGLRQPGRAVPAPDAQRLSALVYPGPGSAVARQPGQPGARGQPVPDRDQHLPGPDLVAGWVARDAERNPRDGLLRPPSPGAAC